jgi:hypothetical protein
MSAPIALDDTLVSESIEFYSALQQSAVQRRYWRVFANPVPGLATFDDVAAEVSSLVAIRYKTLMANGAKYLGTRVRRVSPVGLDQWGVSVVGAGDGTAGAVAAPGQVAGLITFLSPFLGKSGEGRMYVPFPALADIVGDGSARPAYVVALTSLAGKFTLPLSVVGPTGGTWELDAALWSPSAPAEWKNITDSRASSVFATQRRRGAYGRLNRLPF